MTPHEYLITYKLDDYCLGVYRKAYPLRWRFDQQISTSISILYRPDRVEVQPDRVLGSIGFVRLSDMERTAEIGRACSMDGTVAAQLKGYMESFEEMATVRAVIDGEKMLKGRGIKIILDVADGKKKSR